VTFFPHTFLPLHVFEARYRAMVTDALSRDRRLAVVRLQPGWEARYEGKPAVSAVAGAGEIASWERLSSGRYNILLRGLMRVGLEQELPTDTLYRLVRARRLEDVAPTGDVAPLVGRIRASCAALLRALDRPRDLLEAALGPDQLPAVIADRAAAAFVPDAAVRQRLLEQLDVHCRLVELADSLETLVEEIRRGPGP
jgi:Lon protease-like protein